MEDYLSTVYIMGALSRDLPLQAHGHDTLTSHRLQHNKLDPDVK